MAGMTWLHLSDWHQKGKDFDRDVVRNALIEDIEDRAKIHADLAKLDFVIFSGDAAFSGQAEEYQVALEQLFTRLLKATGLQQERFFFVPGNHDFDRDELNYLPADIKQPFTTERQIQDWLIDNKKRNHLLKPFAAFTDFVREFTGQEQPAYTSIRSFVVDGKQVTLLGLNSALMCGRNKNSEGEVSDQNFLIVGEPQLYEPLRQIANFHVRITVLHHPFDWLTEFDRNRVEGRLIRGSHFILCGHLHKPNVTVQVGMAGDCVIIPAGASYDRRVPLNPRYANSYNFVHLDFETGKGTVYLRRWSDTRNEGSWIEDVDSCKDGVFQFDFPKSLRDSLSISPVEPIVSAVTSQTVDEDAKKPHKQDSTLSGKPQISQQQPSITTNTQDKYVTSPPSPPVRRDESPLLNRDDLLEALSACPEGVFVKVVAFSHVPPGILSGYDKPQAVRADELIRWAEFEGVQGLQKLNEALQRAKYGKKTVDATNAPVVNTLVSRTPAPSLPTQRDELPPGERSDPSQLGASTNPPLALPDTSFDATQRGPLMRLSEQECSDLTDDLLAAYPVREDFEIMLKVKLHKNLNTLVDDAHNYWNLIFKLIQEITEPEGWTSDLVIAAYERRPRNPELQKWHQRYSTRQETPGEKKSYKEEEAKTLQNLLLALLERSKVARPTFVQLTKDEQENLTNLINYSLVSIAGKLSADEFLILARVYIGIAHDSVQNAKKPFEGMGDVRQIHYRHVTESIFMTSTCMLRLRELLNTTPHLPNTIAQFREQLIVEVNLVIAWMGPEGSDNRRQETKPRKEDVKKKFTSLLQKLDELDRHIQGRDLP